MAVPETASVHHFKHNIPCNHYPNVFIYYNKNTSWIVIARDIKMAADFFHVKVPPFSLTRDALLSSADTPYGIQSSIQPSIMTYMCMWEMMNAWICVETLKRLVRKPKPRLSGQDFVDSGILLVILDITCPIRDTSTINPTHITMVG
jgi:hypothetical protein